MIPNAIVKLKTIYPTDVFKKGTVVELISISMENLINFSKDIDLVNSTFTVTEKGYMNENYRYGKYFLTNHMVKIISIPELI
jgi:hypothetical protein